MSDRFFDEKYDVVIIGGALAGLCSALQLSGKGKKVLILEQHNLPGGIATSFTRSGVEIEGTLHEMMSIGENNCLAVGQFFKQMGVNIDWIRVPEAYRFIEPGVNVLVHAGTHGDMEVPAKDIVEGVGGKVGDELYQKVLNLLNLCHTVYQSVNAVSTKHMSKAQMLLHHPELVKTAGYSTKEVIDTFNLPKKVVDILSAYWIYVGSPFSELPFTIFAVLMGDYLGYGSYIPKKFSFEMSLKLCERVKSLGTQIEFGQRVDKILVKDKKVTGVRLASGEEIKCDYVISGSYPNAVYSHMVEPIEEVPPIAIKYVNSKDIGVTCFSVVMLLDKSAEELGIKDYSVFTYDKDLDLDEIWKQDAKESGWTYLTTICTNIANPEASPKGTCILSITTLPQVSCFDNVTEETYDEWKQKNALAFIESESKRLGVNLRDHILELVIEAPATISHYTGDWQGSIYGYRHTMNDHVVARLSMVKDEQYISGLAFAGAHAISGDGMGPAVKNGRKAALVVLEEMKRREESK